MMEVSCLSILDTSNSRHVRPEVVPSKKCEEDSVVTPLLLQSPCNSLIILGSCCGPFVTFINSCVVFLSTTSIVHIVRFHKHTTIVGQRPNHLQYEYFLTNHNHTNLLGSHSVVLSFKIYIYTKGGEIEPTLAGDEEGLEQHPTFVHLP